MNSAYFMARAAQRLSCSVNLRTGYAYDFIGQEVNGCADCAGCDSSGRTDMDAGLVAAPGALEGLGWSRQRAKSSSVGLARVAAPRYARRPERWKQQT